MSIWAVLDAPGVKGKKVTSIGADSRQGVGALMRSIMTQEHDDAKDPFYVLDLGVLVELYKKWHHCLPMLRPFYAVKCNPDPALLGAMASLGAGFDCASRAEIEAVLALGVPPAHIVYANPCKAESHIKFAAAAGVILTTFDSSAELDKLRRCHPGCKLLLRLKAPDDGNAQRELGSKYGALPDEVVPLLLASHAAGLAVAGISFHIGSGAKRVRAFCSAIAAARAAFDEAELLGLPPMRVLNIGGGFMADAQFEEASRVISSALLEHFADVPELTVIAEPGRFFAETAFTLATNIIGKRVRGKLREYWINDGIYGSLAGIPNIYATMTAALAPIVCSSDGTIPACNGKKTYASTVFGPTCDALDTLLTGHLLPELHVGDWLVFPNMGAYAMSIGSNFNGFATSAIRTYLACSNP